jgi:predicted nucleic acid-binding protein
MNKRIVALPEGTLCISRISRMELLSKGEYKLNPDAEYKAYEFLSRLAIIPITRSIERHAIAIRRNNHTVKLPDALIGATALVMGAPLISCDKDLVSQLKNAVPTLSAEYVKPLDTPAHTL